MTWRAGGARQGQLVVIRPEDFKRVGHCWMNGRLLAGDLAMVVSHSGDCFWQYRLVNHGFRFGGGKYDGRVGYQLIPQSEFGAYTLGEPYRWQPSEREMHLLLAGESVALDAEFSEGLAEKMGGAT